MEPATTNGEVEVAKKKASKSQSASVHIMCSPEWKAWVEAFAKAEDKPLSRLMRAAAKALAKEKNFRDPPER
jgi:hypothetical protein